MNVKRFTARTSREALMLVRQAFGDDAVVVSTRPCPEGVEVLAMAPESVQQFERMASPGNPAPAPAAVRPAARQTARGALPAPVAAPTVDDDVEQLAMSTLSFQDYVRERMLKRRQAELEQPSTSVVDALRPPPAARAAAPQASPSLRTVGHEQRDDGRRDDTRRAEPARHLADSPPLRHAALRERIANPPRREPPVLRDEVRLAGPGQHDLLAQRATSAEHAANAQRNESMGELRT